MKKINQAFTLIELLVVIAIIGILSGLIVISMSSAINAARDAKIKSDMATLSHALLVYSANNSTYPGGTGTTPDTYPCTIGGGTTRCTNLEANLAPYLTAIPKTPNGGFYTYSYSGTGPSFTLQSTLSNNNIYQYNSASYFSTINYTSTCEFATNAQVQCIKTDISLTEEICKCTYLSGAGTTSWTVPNGVTQVQYLIVAGGGGGGRSQENPTGHGGSGGGGAGGLLSGTGFIVNGNISVIVGSGGLPATVADTKGGNGSSSTFSSITAIGGGGGGAGSETLSIKTGSNGGSGGGGGWGSSSVYGVGGDADYISPRQGYDGGGAGASNAYGGGGGGAGQAGNTNGLGRGGDGVSNSITGAPIYYAGGGGGGNGTGSIVLGGNGGGGSGQNTGGFNGTNGLGGGGGGSYHFYNGGAGGSGVVIFRYTHP
jgi:prepilin-type N-terminal cleavage/methylation domain-containing protein